MVPISALWLPILVAAVLVFAASSIIHMFLGYHKSDFGRLTGEKAALDALRPGNLAPGDYIFPYADSMDAHKSDAYREKVEKGLAGIMTIIEPDAFLSMGKAMGQWFMYCVVVGVLVAYATGRTLAPEAEYLDVFRLAGTVAFCCYAVALPHRSIWYHQKWSTTVKSMCDGLVYAVLTGGAFGWLWPS